MALLNYVYYLQSIHILIIGNITVILVSKITVAGSFMFWGALLSGSVTMIWAEVYWFMERILSHECMIHHLHETKIIFVSCRWWIIHSCERIRSINQLTSAWNRRDGIILSFCIHNCFLRDFICTSFVFLDLTIFYDSDKDCNDFKNFLIWYIVINKIHIHILTKISKISLIN